MKFVLASYATSPQFNNPEDWLKRINIYAGVPASLSKLDEVICIEQINFEGPYFKDGVAYHFMRFNKWNGYFPLKLHRYIKTLQPDVVLIHGLHFSFQIIQLRLCLGRQVKIIAQHHAEQPFAGIRKPLQHFADRYINAYLFASKNMGLQWVHKGIVKAPGKIHEVMEVSSVFYPLAKELAVQKTGVTGKDIFLWVGRLDKNKDPLTMVKAFLQFAAIHPSARLYMLYHTTELLAEIQALLENNSAGDAIVLIGKVPHDEMIYWFNSADFFVSASHYEGSGTAICEAMSCGCIPIVTAIFSFKTITDNGRCGLLFTAGNEYALLLALLETQQVDRKKIQQNILAHFTSTLSFAAIAERIHQVAVSL